MKLSEAILLGSTVLAAKAGGQHFSENQAGCALGMAAVARGCTFGPARHPVDKKEQRTLSAERIWGDWLLHTVVRPCRCWRFAIPRKRRVKDIIAHIFDYHVMTKRNWTLEQLVAWVKTVEPKDVDLPPASGDILDDPLARQDADQWRRNRIAQREEKQDQEEWQAVVRAFAAKHESRHSSSSRRAKL